MADPRHEGPRLLARITLPMPVSAFVAMARALEEEHPESVIKVVPGGYEIWTKGADRG